MADYEISPTTKINLPFTRTIGHTPEVIQPGLFAFPYEIVPETPDLIDRVIEIDLALIKEFKGEPDMSYVVQSSAARAITEYFKRLEHVREKTKKKSLGIIGRIFAQGG